MCLSRAAIIAPATAELLPCSTTGMPWSVAARSSDNDSSTEPLLSKRTSASGRAPPGSFTPPRALTRSVAQIRLRKTASPPLPSGPESPSISASRMGTAAGFAATVAGAATAVAVITDAAITDAAIAAVTATAARLVQRLTARPGRSAGTGPNAA